MNEMFSQEEINSWETIVRAARAKLKVPILWRVGLARGVRQGVMARELVSCLTEEEARARYGLWAATAEDPGSEPDQDEADDLPHECVGFSKLFDDVWVSCSAPACCGRGVTSWGWPAGS